MAKWLIKGAQISDCRIPRKEESNRFVARSQQCGYVWPVRRYHQHMANCDFEDYRFELRPLTEQEGGGWLITWPDLPGCMSDGETPERAIEQGREVFAEWFAIAGDATRRQAFVASDPEILSGTPCFAGTRVPVRILFEHLTGNDTLETFLDDFPSDTRDQAIQVLEKSKQAILASVR